MPLPDSAKDLIRSGALGHLVTLGKDGAPQVTVVWVGVDGDDLLTAHLNPQQQKVLNVQRDPRVVVSFEGSEIEPPGLHHNLVVYGTATVEEGGARGAAAGARLHLPASRREVPAHGRSAAGGPAADRRGSGAGHRPVGRAEPRLGLGLQLRPERLELGGVDRVAVLGLRVALACARRRRTPPRPRSSRPGGRRSA